MFDKIRVGIEGMPFWSALIVVGILLGLVFGVECLIVWIAMLLWNSCLVAAIPLVMPLSFWQMWGIYILCNVLFKTVRTNKN